MSLIKAILWPFEMIGRATIAIGQSFFGNDRKTNTQADKPKPFRNRVTGTLLWIVLLLIGGGIILILLGSILGVVIASVGIVIWWAGFTRIKPDPITAMVLTYWGSYIEFGGKPVVVGGNTILANYWPLYISGTEFEMTDEDMDFEVEIYAGGKVPMKGTVSLTLKPNIEDAIDYIQSGRMSNIRKIIDDIVESTSKLEAEKHTAAKIASDGTVIAKAIFTSVEDKIQAQSLGVKITKTQASFKMPKKVEDAMEDAIKEMYDREAEFAEYETDYRAAELLQAKYKADTTMAGKVPNLEACLEQIKALRLIRDGKVIRIDSSGKVGTMVFPGASLNVGGVDKPEKKNRRD